MRNVNVPLKLLLPSPLSECQNESIWPLVTKLGVIQEMSLRPFKEIELSGGEKETPAKKEARLHNLFLLFASQLRICLRMLYPMSDDTDWKPPGWNSYCAK